MVLYLLELLDPRAASIFQAKKAYWGADTVWPTKQHIGIYWLYEDRSRQVSWEVFFIRQGVGMYGLGLERLGVHSSM